MNRSEGLVQRRTAAAAAAASGSAVAGQSDSGYGSRTDNLSSDYRDDRTDVSSNGIHDQDDDSKQTRLTLMEEVLLLGLKDKEVCLTNGL